MCLVVKPLNRSEAKVDLVMIKNLVAFQMQIDTGLHHNKVTFSLTPNQRLDNLGHNCRMAYCQFLSQDHGGGGGEGGREGGISFKSSLNLQSSLQTAAKKLSRGNSIC